MGRAMDTTLAVGALPLNVTRVVRPRLSMTEAVPELCVNVSDGQVTE